MLQNLSDRALLVFGALMCAIAAWCTIGYHHPDEHFQIWEFANYKLGNIPASELPWEFPEQMRPGLQPFLAYCLVVVAKSLGITDPFVQIFLMRLLCGAVSLWLCWMYADWLSRDLKSPNALRWLRISWLLFWAMPYLHVRFSSENTSAICFFGGVLLLLQAYENRQARFGLKWIAAGLLLGISFFFRYQIAFAGIGLGAWLLFSKRLNPGAWVALIFGAMFAASIGLLTDYWLYGEWVFAPYNYFTSNIMDGKAAEFGVEPCWWYLTEMPIALMPPLSLAMIALFFWGIWRKPFHALSWCIVPFILAHSAVAHKEVRFMFPMLIPFFFLIMAGWEGFQEKYSVKRWMRAVFGFCLGLNLLVLVLRALIPAKEMAAYSQFLWYWQKKHPDSEIFFVKNEPRKNYPLNMPFYNHPAQKQTMWYTDTLYRNDTTALHTGDLMFFTEVLAPPPAPPPGFRMHRVFAYYPDWLLYFNLNDWQSRTRIWAVYSLEKE